MYTFELNGVSYTNFDDESVAELVSNNVISQAEKDSIIAEQQADIAKQTGKLYNDTGITVPFTSNDAIVVLQVKAAFEVGLTYTVIKFSNGQRLPMQSSDFNDFAVWFAAERNRFFI